MCGYGHAPVAAATGGAGTAALSFFLGFSEECRIVFQGFHVGCPAEEHVAEIGFDGAPVILAVQLLDLGSGLGQQDKGCLVFAQDGGETFEVTDFDSRHFVQEIDERDAVLHGELTGGDGHQHADDRGVDGVLREVVAHGKHLWVLRVDEVIVKLVSGQDICQVLVSGKGGQVVAQGRDVGGLCLLRTGSLQVSACHHRGEGIALQEGLQLFQ